MESQEQSSESPRGSPLTSSGSKPEPSSSSVTLYDGPLVPRPVAVGMAITITVVWAAGFLGDIFLTDFEVPQMVHFIMLGTAAAIFGGPIFTRRS